MPKAAALPPRPVSPSPHWVARSPFSVSELADGPGMSTASWEVTGVLARGGVPFGERSEPTFLFRNAAGEESFGQKSHFPWILSDF